MVRRPDHGFLRFDGLVLEIVRCQLGLDDLHGLSDTLGLDDPDGLLLLLDLAL